MKCPICDKEIENHTTDYMEHILCEEYAECKDEHHRYYYRYNYGAWEETIGRVTFTEVHNDSKELRRLVNSQYKAVLELEREHYKNKKQ